MTMEHIIGVIRKFETQNFTVIVDAIEEDDLDLSWDEDGETQRGLESGKYVAFVARARVFMNGVKIANEYLGSCVYESLEAFMDHRECGKQTAKLRAEGSNAICGSYFSDMVHSVCQDARKHLNKIQSIKVRKVA